MDVKGKVLLQLFNKRKLRNTTKTYLEQNFFSTVKFKNLGFSAPLIKNTTSIYISIVIQQLSSPRKWLIGYKSKILTICLFL